MRLPGMPVLPVKKGVKTTKIHILVYIIAFTIAAASLTYFKFAGWTYLIITTLLGLTWLWFG